MIATHQHHKVPKHIGGSNDPSNLVELTIEDHAIAHKVLYHLWKRKQDLIAWKTLSGQITSEEARKQAAALAMSTRDNSSFRTPEFRNKQRKASVKRNSSQTLPKMRGMTHWQYGKPNTRWIGDNNPMRNPEVLNKRDFNSSNKKAARTAMENGTHPSCKKVVCPYCSKEGKGNGMKRWHFDMCKYKNHR